MSKSDVEPLSTRASLIHRLRDWKDQSSWQDFFDTYWRLIYRVARKAGLRDAEAQDVVQETMASVAKHMPTFRYDPSLGSFKAWLLKLTHWRIIGQFRKRGPQERLRHPTLDSSTRTDPVQSIPDPGGSALGAMWEAEWRETLLHAATDRVKRRLDPEKYQLFDCYVNKGWSPDKVAHTFGVSVGQVYLAKNRVTEKIKQEIRRLEREIT